MTIRDIAHAVLGCVGGVGNVVANSLCMTRLRITVANPLVVNRDSLDLVEGVLGTASRGSNGIEVVFGPKVVQAVFAEFSRLTGIASSFDPQSGFRHSNNLLVHIAPRRDASADDPARGEGDESAAFEAVRAEDDGLDLTGLLDDDELEDEERADDSEGDAEDGLRARRLLVINGPNINMLGVREPAVYGKEDYAALLELCKAAAREAGFVECRCFQSNHEGALVDEIQDALGVFDGIVMNPAAYTHTSIALLDALKAVSIPTIEVHISKVEEREDFRQVSYVRRACIETITGLGLEGYRVAINHMADHLGMERDN